MALIFSTAFGTALEVYVAPLYYINEAAGRQEARNGYQNRLLTVLNNVETDVELRFKSTAGFSGNPPQSLLDAITVSRTVHAEYLLYGFIAEKEYTIQAEVRLLEYETRTVIATFYAMDEKGQEDRLLKNIANKVYQFIDDTFNIPIIEKPPRFTHLSIPASIGYWTPMGQWVHLVIGTFTINGGLRFIPADNLFIAGGYAYHFSTGFTVTYRLGLGTVYDAYYHGITLSVPLLLHQKLDDEKEIYYGTGFSYSVDFLNISKPYEEPTVERYAAMGILLEGGYRWRYKENIFFFGEGRIDVHFYDTAMASFSVSFGAEWRIYTREVRKKW
jgi:hypothetical protein